MFIVINLSKKLVGYSLFSCFLNDLKCNGKLLFANDNIISNENDYELDELKEKIETILFNNHVNNWNVCLLCDANDMKNDPLKYSMVGNISRVKEHIITPISKKYSFNNLYYINIDDLKRNVDGTLVDAEATLAFDLDSKGYLVHDTIESKYIKSVFTFSELSKIDKKWNTILKDTTKSEQKRWEQFKSIIVTDYFDKKINNIEKENINWYYNALCKIRDDFDNFEYNNQEIVPSSLLKYFFETYISSVNKENNLYFHFMYERNEEYNSNVNIFRSTLKILSFLMYISTEDVNDTLLTNYNPLYRENHWKVSLDLNDKNIQKILTLYNQKLDKEKNNISKMLDVRIKYPQYHMDDFNLELNMRKPLIDNQPSFSWFDNDKDFSKMELYKNHIIKRYNTGKEYANERMKNLTEDLRKQKESKSFGETVEGSLLEVIKVKEDKKLEVKDKEEKNANYRASDYHVTNQNDLLDYDIKFKDLNTLMKFRINKKAFITYTIFLLIVLNSFFYFLKTLNLDIERFTIYYFISVLIPILVFVVIIFINVFQIKKRISKKLKDIYDLSEKHIEEFYAKDSKESDYIRTMYEVVILNNYISKLEDIIKKNSIQSDLYNNHLNELNKHYDISKSLLENLNVPFNEEFLYKEYIDIPDIKYNLSSVQNKIYCPVEYFSDNDLYTEIMLNNQVCETLKNRNIGCLKRIEFKYDEGYKDER